MGFGLLLTSMTETMLSLEIVCPTDIVVDLPPETCDEVVNFQVSATDDTDPDPQITQIDLSGLSSGDAFPIGTHVLEFEAMNSSGATATCSFQVQVNEHTPSAGLDCKDDHVVYLGPDGCLTLTPQMILNGNDYGCYDNYSVEVLNNPQGFSIGATICCDYAGETHTARINHPEQGQCWGAITFLDTLPPVFDCTSLTVGCMSDYSTLPLPSVEDNCEVEEITLVSEELVDDVFCDDGQVLLQRLVTATDVNGNEAIPCLQQITISRTPEPVFPDDRVWYCQNYNEFQQVTEAQPYTGDLATTGSGIVENTDGPCAYEVAYEDEVVNLCGNTFEILRTWTLTDLCNDEDEVHVQSILIADTVAPVLIRSPYTVFTNITGEFPPDCTSEGYLQIPEIEDACNDWTLRIFTELGEAIYLNGIDGDLGGYIPAPGLDPGIYTVTYEAEDACGNISTLEVDIEVVDAAELMPLVLNCPKDEELSCNIYIEDLAASLELGDYSVLEPYGEVLLFENCLSDVTYTVTDSVDQDCFFGDITRTWMISDDNGMTECTQTITILHDNYWEVQFPLEITVQCQGGELGDTGEPMVFFDECELIGIAFEDQIFIVVPDACYKIERTWTAINWCVYDGVSGNSILDTLLVPGRFRSGADGYLSFTQTIKVNDNEQPSINIAPQLSFCIEGDSCNTDLTLPMPDVSDCSDINSITVTSDMPGAVPGNTFQYTQVPPGVYEVEYKVKDICSNIATQTVLVEVVDCQEPNAICNVSATVQVNMFGLFAVEVNAEELLDDGSFDNCSDLIYSFSPDTSYTEHTFFCNDAQQGLFEMELWVTDAAGNQSSCDVFVVVQDNDNTDCDLVFNEFIVYGEILTENGIPVVGAEVLVDNNPTLITDSLGRYLDDYPISGDYTFTPFLDTNPTNGVTTFDMVLIQLHVLGLSVLDSPYKLIAADINNSGTITTLDIVAGRKLILTIDPTFPNNTSWRFVDASYVFPDPTNPWAEVFPESRTYLSLMANQLDADFVGVKIGDVNQSASFSFGDLPQDRELAEIHHITVTDKAIAAGERFEVFLQPEAMWTLGCQFTLEFDPLLFELEAVLPGLAGAEHLGLHKQQEGVITASWNTTEPHHFQENTPLFGLQLKAKEQTRISSGLRISSQHTLAEAYGAGGELYDLAINFTNAIAGVIVYQNRPNPFRGSTRIGIYLPEPSPVTLTLMDVSGRVLRQVENDLPAGYQELELDRLDEVQGLLYYQVTTPGHSVTKKMLAH